MMIDVFYDGKCGLCNKEITYYRRIAPDAVFNWLDIANDPAPLQQYHISQSDALRQLHVRDAKGDWHIGADAFIVIWRKLRYWWILAVLVGLPGVKQLARLIYNRFANYRFTRLAHCQIAIKQDAKNIGK
jgi:predicted DCC family thiol-disulfide oxidoreductase YuxK